MNRRQLASLLGLDRLSAQRRRVLRYVLLGSLGVHVLFMAIFGSWIIVKAVRGEKTTFVSVPALKTYEPRKLEFKVKVQKQQRSSSRPSMLPRLVASKAVKEFTLPEIKMDPKIVKTTFQPKFKAFSGTGLGAGLGTGYGVSGFGTGVAQFDFFGIRGRGDKIAILVDVSISMVEPERGGPKGYERVKGRINKVIDELPEGAMFNVFVFADAASAFQTNMIVATADNKGKAKLFLRPFNTEGNLGLTTGNISPSRIGLPSAGGTTRLDLALTAAFEQGADTILIISDGLPRVRKVLTEEAMKEYQNVLAGWQAQNASRVAAWDNANAAASREERVWIPPTPARPPRPALREGEQPDPGAPAQPGRWEVRRLSSMRTPRPAPPPPPDPGWWTLGEFIEHLKLLHEKLYLSKGKKLPVIHAIGYAIDKDGGDFLSALAQTYKGRYRRVARID